jgi:hypothetical protein
MSRAFVREVAIAAESVWCQIAAVLTKFSPFIRLAISACTDRSRSVARGGEAIRGAGQRAGRID